jgi:hypothetical protein
MYSKEILIFAEELLNSIKDLDQSQSIKVTVKHSDSSNSMHFHQFLELEEIIFNRYPLVALFYQSQ